MAVTAFIEKLASTAVTGVTTTYDVTKPILLQKNTAVPESDALPGGGHIWSHIEIILSLTSGGPCTTVHTFLSWDDLGDDIAAGPTQTAYNLQAGLTTTTDYMVVIPLNDIAPTAPTADQTTANKVYAWVKVDAGTVTIKRYRLHGRRLGA